MMAAPSPLTPHSLDYFNTHVLVRHPDARTPDKLGFKDLKLGVLSPAKIEHELWDYLGNHGCFIKKMFGDETPFERFYYVARGSHLPPILAYRLRPDVIKRGPCYDADDSRIFDSYERLDWNTAPDELCLVQLIKEKFPPEADMGVPEAFFVQQFPDAKRWV